MIKTKELYKKLGKKHVLNNITFQVKRGHIYGLLGKNGAGKTTLINCLTGIFTPSSGEIRINGEDPYENISVKQKISYVPDEYPYPEHLNAKQIISQFLRAYESFSIETYQYIIEKFKLNDCVIGRKLSRGMKTQLMLALKLSTNPKILFLDEPTNGLDPVNQQIFFEILIDLITKNDMTVFISSHYIEGIEKMCDKVGVISEGNIILEDDVDNFKSQYYLIDTREQLYEVENIMLLKIKNETYQYIGKLSKEDNEKYESIIISKEKLDFTETINHYMKGGYDE